MSSADSMNAPLDLKPMGQAEAEKMVAQYLASFPYLSLPNPEGYVISLAELFQRYPRWAAVCAIQRENKDNPNIPVSSIQFRKWLEEIVGPAARLDQWTSTARKQLDEQPLLDGPATPKQSYDDFKAEMAERGLPIDKKQYHSIGDVVPAILQKYGLTQAQWDAMPEGISIKRFDQLVAEHRGKRF